MTAIIIIVVIAIVIALIAKSSPVKKRQLIINKGVEGVLIPKWSASHRMTEFDKDTEEYSVDEKIQMQIEMHLAVLARIAENDKYESTARAKAADYLQAKNSLAFNDLCKLADEAQGINDDEIRLKNNIRI